MMRIAGKTLLVWVMALSGIAHAATIHMVWEDGVNTTHSGYIIERRLNSAGAMFAEVGQVGAAVLEYMDSTASDGTSYCYRVMAFQVSDGMVGPPSNEACVLHGRCL